MFTFNVDLGQILIASLIAIVGWLLINKITGIDDRLDRHDSMILEIWQFLTGKNHGKG
jgi:hypothetical protein